MAASHVSVLVLAPFNSFPKVSFDNVKLGSSAVRRVTVQNPTQKRVKVALTSPPKQGESSDFEVDFVEFFLGPQQEATLRVGWVPRKGGNVAEKLCVKYGLGLQTRIVLVGSCAAPREKPKRPSRAPLHNNSNMQRTFSKGAANAQQQKAPLPDNPVSRAAPGETPEVRDIPSENMPPPPATKQLLPPPRQGEPSWSPQKLSESRNYGAAAGNISGGDESVFLTPLQPGQQQQEQQQEQQQQQQQQQKQQQQQTEFKLPSPLKSNGANIRRETFVAAKPSAPAPPPPVQPAMSLVRKDTYTVKSSTLHRDTYSVSSDVARKETFMVTEQSSQQLASFVASTPANKNFESDPRFRLDNISVIKNVGSQLGEKRSSWKELKFPATAPKKISEDEQQPPSPPPQLRRETFLASEAPAAGSRPQSQTSPKVEELTKPVNISDIVQNFMDLDDSREAQRRSSASSSRKDDGSSPTLSSHHEQTTVLAGTRQTPSVVNNVGAEVQEEIAAQSADISPTPPPPAGSIPNVTTSAGDDDLTRTGMQGSHVTVNKPEQDKEQEDVANLDRVSMCDNMSSNGCKKMVGSKDSPAGLSDSKETYVLSQSPSRERQLSGEEATNVAEQSHKDVTNLDGVSMYVNVSSNACEKTVESKDSAADLSNSRETYVLSQSPSRERNLSEEEATNVAEQSQKNVTNLDGLSMYVNVSNNESEKTVGCKDSLADLSNSRETYVLSQSPSRERHLSGEEATNVAEQSHKEELVTLPQLPPAACIPSVIITSADDDVTKTDMQASKVSIEKPEQNKAQDVTNLDGVSMFVNISSNTCEKTVGSKDSLADLSNSRETYVLSQSPSRERHLSEEEATNVAEQSHQKASSEGKVFTMSISPPGRPGAKSEQKPPKQAASTEKMMPPTLNRTTTGATGGRRIPHNETRTVGRATRVPPSSESRPVRQLPLVRKPRPSLHRLTLIKPQRMAKMATVIRNPNPFASKNIYYDERWVEKQETGFMKWLNFVLTPDCLNEGEGATTAALAPGKLDVAKLWRACSSEVKVPRAPTKEVLSMRAYTVRREMNRLRRRACTLWQTPAVAKVIARMETEVS